MKKFQVILLVVGLLFSFGRVSAKEKIRNASPKNVVDFLFEEGLTCEIQKILIVLNHTNGEELGERISYSFFDEEIIKIKEKREKGCLMLMKENSNNIGSSGKVVNLIKGTTGSGAYRPLSIFRDSSKYGWMCNGGSSEWPADYIAEYSIPNSYANRSRLRIQGVERVSSCYINNFTISRVYIDNNIRVCFEYWDLFFCQLGVDTLIDETAIWIEEMFALNPS